LTAATQRERAAREEVSRERDKVRTEKTRADFNLAKARQAVEDYCTNVAEDKRLKQAGFHVLRKQLLQTAVPFYEDVIEQQRDDPELQGERVSAYGRLWAVRAAMGETTEAVADYQRGQAIFVALTHLHPANPGYRHDLAKSHQNLSYQLEKMGRD